MRNIETAIAWGEAQVKHPTQDWYEHCEQFARECYDLPAYAGSAKIAAGKVPAEHRQTSTPPHRGALVYYLGIGGQYGHVAVSVGDGNVLSTDYGQKGHIAQAPWNLPNWHATKGDWFWTKWTPFGHIS
jgi:hypothetical protein